jgi:PAS domain S-box-containing protein
MYFMASSFWEWSPIRRTGSEEIDTVTQTDPLQMSRPQDGPSRRGYTGRVENGLHRAAHEQLLAAIVECSADAMAAVDLDGRVLTWNPAATAMYGYRGEEIIGCSAHVLIAEEARAARAEAFRSAAGGSHHGPDHVVHVRKDGTRFDASVTLTPVRDATGLMLAVAVIVRDVTERLRERSRVEAAEATYRLLAENATDVIVRNDQRGVVLYASPSVREVYGYEASELLHRSFLGLVHPDDLATADAAVERLRERPAERVAFQVRFRHRDGRWLWSETTARGVLDQSGALVELQGSVRDISDRKAVEQQLRAANEELSRFAYATSHDLREPLGVIQVATDAFLDAHGAELSGEGLELIEHARDSAVQMQALLDDLLRLFEVDTTPLVDEPVDLGSALEAALDNLGVVMGETGASVSASPLPTVSGHRGLLVQVFQNLVANALKFTAGRRPRVRVEAAGDDGWWRVSVADNGVGIEPADRRRVFAVFSRLDGHAYAGTGVGLALCQRIVERHGGRIWVDSTPGVGSVFSFTLPRAPWMP